MRQSIGFLLGLAFLGCAPIDGAEPTEQVSLAGGVTVGSCVPDRIVTVYAINIWDPLYSEYNPLHRLDVPCGRESIYRRSTGLSGPACYGPDEPLYWFPQTDLLPTPGVAPLDGRVAAPIAGIRCLEAIHSFLPNSRQRVFLIVTPAAQLREVDSQQGDVASWGQRYRRQVGTDLLYWDGYDTPGLYFRETYDRHAAVIYRRDPNTGTWADRIETGANSFQLLTANQAMACHEDPLTADLGAWQGHTSNTTNPWTPVRYVTCSSTQSLFDARAVLSSTGVNPYYAHFSVQGRLGDYVNDSLFGRRPPLEDQLLEYEFKAYDTPDGAPLPH
jgi:hypothetical protein